MKQHSLVGAGAIQTSTEIIGSTANKEVPTLKSTAAISFSCLSQGQRNWKEWFFWRAKSIHLFEQKHSADWSTDPFGSLRTPKISHLLRLRHQTHDWHRSISNVKSDLARWHTSCFWRYPSLTCSKHEESYKHIKNHPDSLDHSLSKSSATYRNLWMVLIVPATPTSWLRSSRTWSLKGYSIIRFLPSNLGLSCPEIADLERFSTLLMIGKNDWLGGFLTSTHPYLSDPSWTIQIYHPNPWPPPSYLRKPDLQLYFSFEVAVQQEPKL